MVKCVQVVMVLLALAACGREKSVSFNTDIRPILNAKCISCHGGVKQAGGFGLVFRENALRETDSGKFAIVPGYPGRSEMISRVRHDNEELRMPFEASPLSATEIQLLETWIEEGAEWEEHWAYQPPVPPPVPELTDDWVADEIDAFVLSSLRQRNRAPAAAPEKRALLRRVSFDLTGLPAAESLADRFLREELTYESLVDSLLASPAYGEHQAAKWLDLARYADSRGYERDRLREIWRYRDWVIRAFNEDLPYDDFITHQLAGDLLPEPTEDQLVATGFHRNSMSNGEGGTENEEFRVAAVIDRVNTTWEVFQGTTMGCVQCHAHPYDPIRHEEFYTSYALFNNTVDHDHVTEAPVLRTLYARDEVKFKKLSEYLEDHDALPQVQSWKELIKVREPRLWPAVFENKVGGVFTDRADEDSHYLRSGNSFALPEADLTDVAALHINLRARRKGRLEIHLGSREGPLIGSYNMDGRWGAHDVRIPLLPQTGVHRLFVAANGPESILITAVNSVGMEPKLPGNNEEELRHITTYITELLQAKDSITTPVLVETTGPSRRKSHVFTRGNWLVHGAEVEGGVPKLFDGNQHSKINTRLDLAHWLTNPEQPLTARVTVNRIWGDLFGAALVSTVEDLGSQGAKPVHQELLDYLATEYRDALGWSRKSLIRKIVLSSTYRQSSDATSEQLAWDPHNQWLARGPRKRLGAEQIRDQALAVSGLLSGKMYGPGVMPPQPAGLWGAIPHSNDKWQESKGEDRYRRALYTFLRRSAVHPGMTTFDASNREVCLSRRTTTNTPLQALLTLNDPAHLEAARSLAEGVSSAGELEDQIDNLYQLLLLRPAERQEREILMALYHESTSAGADKEAAMVVIANALLNLDEFLTIS